MKIVRECRDYGGYPNYGGRGAIAAAGGARAPRCVQTSNPMEVTKKAPKLPKQAQNALRDIRQACKQVHDYIDELRREDRQPHSLVAAFANDFVRALLSNPYIASTIVDKLLTKAWQQLNTSIPGILYSLWTSAEDGRLEKLEVKSEQTRRYLHQVILATSLYVDLAPVDPLAKDGWRKIRVASSHEMATKIIAGLGLGSDVSIREEVFEPFEVHPSTAAEERMDMTLEQCQKHMQLPELDALMFIGDNKKRVEYLMRQFTPANGYSSVSDYHISVCEELINCITGINRESIVAVGSPAVDDLVRSYEVLVRTTIPLLDATFPLVRHMTNKSRANSIDILTAFAIATTTFDFDANRNVVAITPIWALLYGLRLRFDIHHTYRGVDSTFHTTLVLNGLPASRLASSQLDSFTEPIPGDKRKAPSADDDGDQGSVEREVKLARSYTNKGLPEERAADQ